MLSENKIRRESIRVDFVLRVRIVFQDAKPEKKDGEEWSGG
jgi:hypothetical protein